MWFPLAATAARRTRLGGLGAGDRFVDGAVLRRTVVGGVGGVGIGVVAVDVAAVARTLVAVVAAVVGTLVAAAATTPLDVAKTILQTRGTSTDPEIRHCKGLFDAFRIIWARDGAKGFVRGLSPRVLTFMPSNALCWLSYEFFSASFLLSVS